MRKTLDKMSWNYAISSVQGGFKIFLKKIQDGYMIQNAQKSAINYAIGQIASSGKAKDPSLPLAFREISKFSNALAEIIEKGQKLEKPKNTF